MNQDTFTRALFESLDEAFDVHHGIYLDKGTSLFETLEAVTAAEASRAAGAGCASLAAQVAHITFYLEVIERYMLTGDGGKPDWRAIWRTVRAVTPDEPQAAASGDLRSGARHAQESGDVGRRARGRRRAGHPRTHGLSPRRPETGVMRASVGAFRAVITVRDAAAADRAAIVELERLATEDLRKVYRPTAVALQQRAALDPQLRHLVAVVTGLLVGIVHYKIEDDQLSFLGLAVHPGFRRRGIAAALVAELEAICRRNDCRALTLWTVRETGNVEIFQRLGFAAEFEEPSRLFESDTFPSLSEVFMRKEARNG